MTTRTQAKKPLVTYRTVTGLASSIPVLGLALPLGAFMAGLAALETKRAAIPKSIRLVSTAALVGVAAYVLLWAMRGGAFPGSGIGQFGVAAVLMVGYSRLAPDVSQAAGLVLAVAIGNVAYFVLFPTANTSGDIGLLWKYGISYPATVIVVYLACMRGMNRWTSVGLLGLVGGLSAVLDTRSTSLVCFAAAAVIVAKGRPTRKQVIRTAIVGALLLSAVSVVLPNLIESGTFGAKAQERTLAQTEETSNPLLGGRKEPPLSLVAISGKPLFGWGTPQNLDPDTISKASDFAQALGMGSTREYLPVWIRENGRISLHSVALNAWVEGGILAAIFPFSMIGLSVIALLRSRGRWAPLVALTGAATFWSMLFSPWGGSQVVLMSAWAVLAARAITDDDGADGPTKA